MDYGELLDAINEWTHRADLSTVAPVWVRFATSGFNRDLRVRQMESRDSSTLTAEYSALPADLIEVVSITDSDGDEMRYLDRQQFAAVVASDATPDPAIFTIEDWQLRVLPAPSVSEPLTVTIVYYEQLTPLVASADTNWLLTDHADLYLYASLYHARAWLHDDARLVVVKQMYDSALAELKRTKWAATGIASVRQTDVPVGASSFSITRGY